MPTPPASAVMGQGAVSAPLKAAKQATRAAGARKKGGSEGQIFKNKPQTAIPPRQNPYCLNPGLPANSAT